jgi:hypothetical protein
MFLGPNVSIPKQLHGFQQNLVLTDYTKRYRVVLSIDQLRPEYTII